MQLFRNGYFSSENIGDRIESEKVQVEMYYR